MADEETELNGSDASVLAEFLDTGDMSPSKTSKFHQTVYGCKTGEFENGYDVNGYAAVSRGVNKTISTQNLATLLFKASVGQVSHILDAVPQGTMYNCIFVIDLKKLAKETDIYFDGLGTWEQNCGKVINYFRLINGEAQDSRDDKIGATAFVRCTYRNLNKKSFNRVVVTSTELGLAVIQYFFKGQDEEPFDITCFIQKGVRASTLTAEPRTRGGTKRRAPDGEDSLDGDTSNRESSRRSPVIRPPGMTTTRSLRSPIPTSTSTEPLVELTASTFIQYLQSHVASEKQERAEERQLRREELEQRKQERVEDRQRWREELEVRKRERQDDIDLRKQELSLERSKLSLDQQRWELDRKEKELFLDLLKRKLMEGNLL